MAGEPKRPVDADSQKNLDSTTKNPASKPNRIANVEKKCGQPWKYWKKPNK